MPRLLVLFDPSSLSAARQAELVADGARAVRFAEVAVRALGPSPTGAYVRTFDDTIDVRAYHGVVLVAEQAEAVGALAARCASAGGLAEVVVAACGGEADAAWAMLGAFARLGAIALVGESSSDEAARALGARAAKVAEWVRHAKSHEAKPHHHDH